MEVYKRKLNKEIIQQILDSFVELTGIRAAYFDITETQRLCVNPGNKSRNPENTVYNAITGKNKPLCSFCENLRVFREQDENCMRCDITAFRIAEETARPYVYKCHMGLYEAVVPIFIRNMLSGFLMLGQVAITEYRQTQLQELDKRLQSFGIIKEQRSTLLADYEATTAMSRLKIEAAANMLSIIAQHIVNTDIIYVYDMAPIEKAKHYIHQHYKEALSTGVIAKFAALSPSYLSYLFSRETGYTITQYIDRLRIADAKELLVLTSASVKEISFQIGYSDQNYFSRIFKKHEGISPVEYRKNNKKSC